MNEAQLVALAEMLRNQPDGVLQSQSNQSVRRLRAADAVHAIVERGSRASLSANADASGNMGGVGADGRASGVMTPLPVREVRLRTTLCVYSSATVCLSPRRSPPALTRPCTQPL
jgi:hypothetical protein